MAKEDSYNHADPLRARAERQSRGQPQEDIEVSPDEARRLFHELQVHQIELEMQNEELRNVMSMVENSRRQFYLLFDHAPVGYLVLDDLGMISQVNDTFCRMVDRTPDQVLQQSFLDFIIEADRDIFLGRYRAFFKSPEGKSVEAHLRTHSKEYFVRMEGARIEGAFGAALDQLQPHLLLTVSDLTERKVYEDALHASEERYRSLFTSMEEGFVLNQLIFDERGKPADYRFIDVNPAFERLVGVRRENVLGKTVGELMPGAPPYELERFAKVVMTGESQHFENYVQPINRHYHVHVYSPAQGRFAVLFNDITERVRSEEALRTALEERKVFYRELQHRSKNSMAMIASIISLEAINATEAPVIHALSSLRDRVRTLSELYQLLFLAGDVQKVWLNVYFQQIVDNLKTASIQSTAYVDIQTNLGEILADEKPAAALGLILNELVTNALKYAFPDGRPGKIFVHMQPSGEKLIFKVEDDGIGLKEGFDIHMAEGMGMQLVIMLTGQLGGEITFTPTNPTSFCIKIPLAGLQNTASLRVKSKS